MNKYIFSFCILCSILVLSTLNGCNAKLKSGHTRNAIEADRNIHLARVNLMIKGKEQIMVDSVFTNLKVLGGFPAENLVFAMEAWSIALGVSCGHCHDTNDFSLDTKLKKQIARDMVVMGNLISDQIKSIPGLSERPRVNCYSCHRGELKPKLRPAGK